MQNTKANLNSLHKAKLKYGIKMKQRKRNKFELSNNAVI